MRFRYLIVVLLLNFISSAYTQTGTTTTSTKQTPEGEKVYVTNTGSKYHKSSCGYLGKSSNEISLTDAKKEGYTACSRCSGGNATTTKKSTTATGGQCTAITKAGTRCKRTSATGSNRCWQH